MLSSPVVTTAPHYQSISTGAEKKRLAKSSRVGAFMRLSRLHTWMAWFVFITPPIYTATLYFAARSRLAGNSASLTSYAHLVVQLFTWIMVYRCAGLAHDDVIDREADRLVTRSKTRPVASGEISVDDAILYIGALLMVLSVGMYAVFPFEVLLVTFVAWAQFLVYPYLKRWTYFTQFGGALLIAMGVLQGYIACAALHDPVPHLSGWTHVGALLWRDLGFVLPIFALEFVFELAHETIYGCQDTAEDIAIGLKSFSIYLGFKWSKYVSVALLVIGDALLYYTAAAAGMRFAIPITLLPVLVLGWETWTLDLSVSSSCGRWAKKGVTTKAVVCAALVLDFVIETLQKSQ